MILFPSLFSLYSVRSLFLYQDILELKKLNNSLPTQIRIDILSFLGKIFNSWQANLLKSIIKKKMTEREGIETIWDGISKASILNIALRLRLQYIPCHK